MELNSSLWQKLGTMYSRNSIFFWKKNTNHQSKHLAALFDKGYSSSQIWVAKDCYKTHHTFDIFVLGHMGLVEGNCFGKLCHWYHCLITFQNHCLLFHFLNVCFVNLQRNCIMIHTLWFEIGTAVVFRLKLVRFKQDFHLEKYI